MTEYDGGDGGDRPENKPVVRFYIHENELYKFKYYTEITGKLRKNVKVCCSNINNGKILEIKLTAINEERLLGKINTFSNTKLLYEAEAYHQLSLIKMELL